MSILIRLVLLFMLLLTSQSGIATTTNLANHQYDMNHIVLSDKNYGYDTSSNHQNSHLYPSSVEVQGRSVLALASDFLATKSVKALPSLQVPNAGERIVSDITTAEQTFFRVSSNAEGAGRFLTRVAPANRAQAIEGLALPRSNTAEFIQRVTVPAGTRLQRSRALPAFGR